MEKINDSKLKRKEPEPLPQVIVSIDPGFDNFGYAIATLEGKKLEILHREACQIHDWRDTNPINLLNSIQNWYQELSSQVIEFTGQKAKDAYFIVEQQYWSPTFAAVGLRLRTLQTALVAVLHLAGSEVKLLPSATVKKHFAIHTKNRAQNKVEMKNVLKTQFGIEEDNEHTADCILLLLYFVKNRT
jgi:Holliday junction resolvasome RuvABC endonuclease subunit